MALFHQSERLLGVGETVQPGRWGTTILAAGQAHQFFFREQFLELWRTTQTDVQVSRLACTFAFEDRDAGAAWSSEDSSHYYVVEPVDLAAPRARLDMLWVTWMGEPHSSFDRTVSQCRAYWEGMSTADVAQHAQAAWEWLFGCALRIIDQVA